MYLDMADVFRHMKRHVGFVGRLDFVIAFIRIFSACFVGIGCGYRMSFVVRAIGMYFGRFVRGVVTSTIVFVDSFRGFWYSASVVSLLRTYFLLYLIPRFLWQISRGSHLTIGKEKRLCSRRFRRDKWRFSTACLQILGRGGIGLCV